MSNIQQLKRRIKSAKNIKQITKAMEMVAASKMRRAQQQALSSRPYSRKLTKTLQTIAHFTDTSQHPLLQQSEQGKEVVLLVSTDKALAGSLNTNLFRGTTQYIKENLTNPSFIIVGQKARQYVLGMQYQLIAEFSDLPDPISYDDSLPISNLILNGFLNHEYKSVTVIYMDFISTLVQKIRKYQMLPIATRDGFIEEESLDQITEIPSSYMFEPSAKEILDWILPYYIELSVYQILLEAKASEHSARMVAMKNASENAGEIIYDLTLSYNKQRQAIITAELLDINKASIV